MADQSFSDLEAGEDVTVITAGSFQLVDLARDIRIPPLREVTLPLTPFVLDALRNGNLRLVGSEGAPEAIGGDPITDVEELSKPILAGRVGGGLEQGVPAPRAPSDEVPTDKPENETPAAVPTGDEGSDSSTGNEALRSSDAPRRGRNRSE